MGGPCFVIDDEGNKIIGPAASDNFQIIRFMFHDYEWHSVEQCYQAHKYTYQGAEFCSIQEAFPYASESSFDYGNRVWRLGQRNQIQVEDWDSVKVETMYLICIAKVHCNLEVRQELLATNDLKMVGGPSTWEWSRYNGLIQMLIKKKLNEGVDLSRITSLSSGEFETL